MTAKVHSIFLDSSLTAQAKKRGLKIAQTGKFHANHEYGAIQIHHYYGQESKQLMIFLSYDITTVQGSGMPGRAEVSSNC